MRICGVCQTKVQFTYNIFKQEIGTPPILLSKLLIKCTRGTKRKYLRGGVCATCTDDLRTYYMALLTAKEIKLKILQLIERFDDAELEICRNSMTKKEQQEQHWQTDVDTNSYEHYEFTKIEVDTAEVLEEKLSAANNYDSNEFSLTDEITETHDIAADIIEESNEPELLQDNISETNTEQQTRQPLENETCNIEDDVETEDEAEEINHRCNECGQEFIDYRSFKLHRNKEHPKRFVCQHCGKVLASATGLQKHIQLHNPEKPLSCRVCGKRYHFVVDLKNHEATHTGERPFECHVCGKNFSHFGALSSHKIQHKPMPDGIECDVCGKKFRKQSNLKVHKLSHATVKDYKCPFCKYCSANKSLFNCHLRKNKKCSVLYRNYQVNEANDENSNEQFMEIHF